MKRRNRFFLLTSAVITLLILGGAGVYGWRFRFNPCELAAVEKASGFLDVQLRAYDHLYQFTTTVYQGGIDSPVSKMQQIFMDTQSVEVPTCMETAKEELLNYMATVIHAFRAFEAGEPSDMINDLVNQSNSHFDRYRSALEEVHACAPFCLP